MYAIYAKQKVINGKIICIEPYEKNFNLLKENLLLNQIDDVITYKKGVSNFKGNIKLFINSEDDSGHSTSFSSNKSISVESTTLSEIIFENKISNCNILKIDCEGGEYDILESLPNQDYNKIKKIYFEYHINKNNHEKLNSVIEILKNKKFVIKKIVTNENLGLIFARKMC